MFNINTLAYYAAFALLGMVEASLGPTLPYLADQTGVAFESIGIVFTVRSLGYLLGSFGSGRLYDRLKGHTLMAGALFIMGATMLLVPSAGIFWILLGILFLTGFGAGLLDVGGNTLLVWQHREKVGPYMNTLHFLFGVGSLSAPLILAPLFDFENGVPLAYWLFGLLTLPAGLWLSRLPTPQPVQEEDSGGRIPRGNWGALALFVLFFMFYVGAEVSYGGWIFTYALNNGFPLEKEAALLTSGFWSAFTAGRLISIPVGARLRPGNILIVDFSGALAGLALILLFPGAVWALWAGTLAFGFFVASIFPTMITLAGRRMQVTGNITGYFFLGATVGGMTLPWLIGRFFETIGPGFMMSSIAASFFSAAIFMVLILAVLRRPASVPHNR